MIYSQALPYEVDIPLKAEWTTGGNYFMGKIYKVNIYGCGPEVARQGVMREARGGL